MAKKKEAQEDAGKKQAVRRKKQEDTEKMKEAVKELLKDVKPFELCIVFAEGDNLEDVAYRLTGKHHMYFKVCDYSGVNPCDVKPGTVLRWPVR